MKKTKSLGLALMLAMAGLLSACDTEGPAEEAGETIDRTVEEVEEAGEEAVEETQENIQQRDE